MKVKDQIAKQWNDYIAIHHTKPNAIILGENALQEVDAECKETFDAFSSDMIPSMAVFVDKDNTSRIEVFGLKKFKINSKF